MRYVNADWNGDANMIRKVSEKFRLDLSDVSSGALIAPVKISWWNLVATNSPNLLVGLQQPALDH